MTDLHNMHSLERYLTAATADVLDSLRAGYATASTVVRSEYSALHRLGPIKNESNPAYLVHHAHQEILKAIGRLRTKSDIVLLGATALSELLVAFPLRKKHWSSMVLAEGGRVPTSATVDTLHVDTDATNPDGTRYTLVIPKNALKNGRTNRLLASSHEPVIRWALHPTVNSVLDAYRDARPHLVTGNSLFGLTASGLSNRLRFWQQHYLEPALGFPARWSYHPYRSLAVVTIMKNPRIADPIGVASALLVDSAQMVRMVYGHLRPEDHNTTAASAIYSPHELNPLVSSAVYQGHSR